MFAIANLNLNLPLPFPIATAVVLRIHTHVCDFFSSRGAICTCNFRLFLCGISSTKIWGLPWIWPVSSFLFISLATSNILFPFISYLVCGYISTHYQHTVYGLQLYSVHEFWMHVSPLQFGCSFAFHIFSWFEALLLFAISLWKLSPLVISKVFVIWVSFHLLLFKPAYHIVASFLFVYSILQLSFQSLSFPVCTTCRFPV